MDTATNPIKAALATRRTTLGCWLTLTSAAVAEALAHCGFDWLLIDAEHAPNGAQQVAEQLRAIDAARAHGARAAAVVRVTSNDAALVKRAMDCGAQTLMFPSVDTADAARRAVASMRFPSDGNGGTRGLAGLVRAGRYGLDASYAVHANDNACAIVQIESAKAVDNVDAIAAVEGVDCLFIGPSDLAASLGHLNDGAHLDVADAIARVVASARRAGKAVGIFAVDAQDARRRQAAGIDFIALHSDVAWLTRGAQGAIAAFGTPPATT